MLAIQQWISPEGFFFLACKNQATVLFSLMVLLFIIAIIIKTKKVSMLLLHNYLNLIAPIALLFTFIVFPHFDC